MLPSTLGPRPRQATCKPSLPQPPCGQEQKHCEPPSSLSASSSPSRTCSETADVHVPEALSTHHLQLTFTYVLLDLSFPTSNTFA